MYLFNTPTVLRKLFYKKLIWDRRDNKDQIALTFDDGPVPEVTYEVLDILDKYSAKATFFCVGDNVRKNPEVCIDTIKRGHQIANHTFNHNKFRKSNYEVYLKSIDACDSVIQDIYNRAGKEVPEHLFRPPYGWLNKKAATFISKNHKIIMWSVLSADFDQNKNAAELIKKTSHLLSQGDIVLMHDSLKSADRTLPMLEHYLKKIEQKGLKAVTINDFLN